MAEKQKAKPKPRRAGKEQSERFIKAAREIGVDESGKEFEQLFDRVVSPKHRPTSGAEPLAQKKKPLA
jgi:hypothetical protein